ncbi:MAG: Helix-turn-helix domain [Verrucomicrobiota bacterium]|jgi:predicted site-specific integrase-resolvase
MTFHDKKAMATRYRVSTRTITNWVRDGILPAIKIGNILRFDPDSCDIALKRKSAVQTPADAPQL